MIRIGCCVGLGDPRNDQKAVQEIATLKNLGYDYVELSLRHIAALDADGFAAMAGTLAEIGLPSEACNNFLPAEQRIVGDVVDLPAVEAYVDHAMGRAKQLGVAVIVLGSGGARGVPAGFARDRAWQQLITALHAVDRLAAAHDLSVAIEPLNTAECNILNSVGEAHQLMKEAGTTRVRVLVDYYHLMRESEPLSAVPAAGGDLIHAHFAEPDGRVFPTATKPPYAEFAAALAAAGYAGRLSIEARTEAFAADAERALPVMRAMVAADRNKAG